MAVNSLLADLGLDRVVDDPVGQARLGDVLQTGDADLGGRAVDQQRHVGRLRGEFQVADHALRRGPDHVQHARVAGPRREILLHPNALLRFLRVDLAAVGVRDHVMFVIEGRADQHGRLSAGAASDLVRCRSGRSSARWRTREDRAWLCQERQDSSVCSVRIRGLKWGQCSTICRPLATPPAGFRGRVFRRPLGDRLQFGQTRT